MNASTVKGGRRRQGGDLRGHDLPDVVALFVGQGCECVIDGDHEQIRVLDGLVREVARAVGDEQVALAVHRCGEHVAVVRVGQVQVVDEVLVAGHGRVGQCISTSRSLDAVSRPSR